MKISDKKILVIEDEQNVRSALRDLLESSGFKVYLAEDGKEGIQLAGEIVPDLVLCDIGMPRSDGYNVLKSLQKDIRTKTIPFIFLTAKAGMDDLREGMNLGADDYIIKPYKAGQLLEAVKIRLSKASSNSTPVNHQKTGRSSTEAKRVHEKKERIFVSVNNSPMFLSINEIVWIEADGEYSNVFMKDGGKLFIRKLLKQWEKILPENMFLRIHRSLLINMDYINKMEKSYKNSCFVFLKNVEKPFIISQRYMKKIKSENRF